MSYDETTRRASLALAAATRRTPATERAAERLAARVARDVARMAQLDNARSSLYTSGMTTTQCPGSGKVWYSGTGSPICRDCHRGPGGLHVKAPTRNRVTGRFNGTVPAHQRRES